VSPPVFYVPSDHLRDHGVIAVAGSEGRHAATVRRLRRGEPVVLTDGQGELVEGVVASTGQETIGVDVRRRITCPAPQPRLTVVQAVPKGDRGELSVELMTEVGVDVIVPWQAAHCVVHWDAGRADKALARWRSTSREAAKQSRRMWWPVVEPVATTAGVVDRLRACQLAVVLDAAGNHALAELPTPAAGDVLLVVGPEGGLTPEEVDAFGSAGATLARVGPTVLRASTAGAVAAAVLSASSSRWSTR